MKYAGALNSALQSIGAESRWCVWKYVNNPDNPNKPKKEPINPRTGGGAMVNESSTWADFDTAYEARKKFNCNGFGFFLGGGYAGIDIDDCINDDGNLSDMAGKIIERMNTYTEISPSKHGVHILFKVSEGFTLDGKQGARNDTIGLEIYCGARYLTVTGNIDLFKPEKSIEFRENELLEVYHEYFIATRKNEVKKQPVNASQGENVSRIMGDESDSELWERMFNSQNGAKIRALYDGDISGHDGDDSRADLALCCYLAYWTGHDASRIDRMFRQSGLMRDKWDEMRGSQTYGAMTIEKAMNDTPRYTPPQSVADWKYTPSDGNESGHDDVASIPPENRLQSEDDTHTVLDYLENSFSGDIERVKIYSTRKTGYLNIDKYNSLYNGLYVIGAVTGVGKTTFCGQMADYLASVGEHVLYFALEQTELELVSKGLARLTAQEWLNKHGADALKKYTHTDAMTAIEIRKGVKTLALQRAIESYQRIGKNLRIVECDFNTTTQTIIQTVHNFMEKHRARPVVFVDYLQLVRNPDKRLTGKDAVDDNVRAFKKLSAENELTVFLISSLNRQNYLNVVDFESFKESGAIEYTADVIYGMQLLCMNAGVFNTNQDLQVKRKFVNKAKNEKPRKIEIVGLKNRNNQGYSRYFFEYYSAHDLFVPYVPPAGDESDETEIAEVLDEEMTSKFEQFKAQQSDETNNKVKKGSKRI